MARNLWGFWKDPSGPWRPKKKSAPKIQQRKKKRTKHAQVDAPDYDGGAWLAHMRAIRDE